MPIYKGSNRLASLFKGSQPIARAYRGSVLVFSGEEVPSEPPPHEFVNDEAETLVNAMVPEPDEDRKAAIDAAWTILKIAGTNTQLDAFYILAAHSEQAACLNWIDPATFPLTPSSTTFTSDLGFVNGSLFSLTPDGTTKYQLNSARVGFYSTTDLLNNTTYILNSSTSRLLLTTNSIGQRIHRTNSGTSSTGSPNNAGGAFHGCVRPSSTVQQHFRDGSAGGDTIASVAVPAGAIRFFSLAHSTKALAVGNANWNPAIATSVIQSYLDAL